MTDRSDDAPECVRDCFDFGCQDTTNRCWLGVDGREIAQAFHDTYTRLAPKFGWEPQAGTSGSWDALPEANRRLMVHTVETLLVEGHITYGRRYTGERS